MTINSSLPVQPTEVAAPAMNLTLGKFQIDPLTGFYGQDCLNHLLADIVARNQTTPVSATLALLQLENFYEIRSWLGKSEASLLLGDIGRVLSKRLPKSIILCRCAHYEFAAILMDSSIDQTQVVAEQVRRIVETTAKNSLPEKISLKLGIGLADMAGAGLNKDVIYARARHNLSLSYDLDKAGVITSRRLSTKAAVAKVHSYLKSGQLVTSFQAVVSLKEESAELYELRLALPETLNQLSTEQMFEVIVQNAWGEAVDRWLIKKAAKILQGSANNLKLTLSITHNSMVSSNFLPWLSSYIMQRPVFASRLIIQLSEIDVLTAQHHMNSICETLSRLDIALCINHFGCTDDPFRYLNLLRAEFVKLDAAILQRCQRGNQDSLTLPQLVERLHANGLRVITGKVDNMARLPYLWQSNVNYVQGYSFHRPSSRLDFEFTAPTTLPLH
jgi:diguanylate cyclase (GGDEF)-like protein